MSTQTITTKVDLRPLTLDELEQEYREAAGNEYAAWKVQSVTTQEEGYTQEQAQVAIDQAVTAQRIREAAYKRWQDALKLERWLLSLPIENEPETEYEYTNEDGVFSL